MRTWDPRQDLENPVAGCVTLEEWWEEEALDLMKEELEKLEWMQDGRLYSKGRHPGYMVGGPEGV